MADRKDDIVLQAVIDIEAAKDDAVDSIEKDLGELYGAYFDAVQAEVAKERRLRADDTLSFAVALVLISRLRGILRRKGGDRVMLSYASSYVPLAETALGYFDAIGVDVTASAANPTPTDLAATVDVAGIAEAVSPEGGGTLSGVVDRAMHKLANDLGNLGLDKAGALAVIDHNVEQLGIAIEQRLIPPVQAAILQANLAGQTRDQIIERIETIRNAATPAQAVQQADLSYSQWQRSVIAAKADDLGMKLFRFVGPDDGITSKQCHAMLHIHPHGAPGVLRRDEITIADIERIASEEGHNIDGLMKFDPMTTGGHPNCRHHWSPVTPEYAAEFNFRPTGDPE